MPPNRSPTPGLFAQRAKPLNRDVPVLTFRDLPFIIRATLVAILWIYCPDQSTSGFEPSTSTKLTSHLAGLHQIRSGWIRSRSLRHSTPSALLFGLQISNAAMVHIFIKLLKIVPTLENTANVPTNSTIPTIDGESDIWQFRKTADAKIFECWFENFGKLCNCCVVCLVCTKNLLRFESIYPLEQDKSKVMNNQLQ